MDCRLAWVLGVEPGLCVGQVVPSEDDLFAQKQRRTASFLEELKARGHSDHGLAQSRLRLRPIVHHSDLERGRSAQNVFGFGGVLHARQLNHNSTRALLLNNGLCYAQLVNTVCKRHDVLLHRELLNSGQRGRLDSAQQNSVCCA